MIDKRAPHHQAQPLSKLVVCGDCDHGSWSSATGNITTPGAVVIPLRGVAPADTNPFERNSGDSIDVRVPGNPPVTRTPEQLAADAAAGRAWLDYGILAGGNRRLYGQSIGPRSWIYCPPDGSRWHVELIGPASPALRFRRFGEVPDAAVGVVQVAGLSVERWVEVLGYWYENELFVIDDIRSDGAEFALVTGVFVNQFAAQGTAGSYAKRWPYRLYRIGLSGVPPAVTVTVTLEQSLRDWITASYTDTQTAEGVVAWYVYATAETVYLRKDASTVYPSGEFRDEWAIYAGTRSGWEEWVVGACYVDDVFTRVRYRKEWSGLQDWTHEPESGGNGILFSGTWSFSGAFKLMIGAQELSCVLTDGGSFSGARYVGGLGNTDDGISDGNADLSGLTISAPAAADLEKYNPSGFGGDVGHQSIMPCRVGNRCWSLSAINNGVPHYDGTHYTEPEMAGWGGHTHIGFVSPGAVVSTLVQVPAMSDGPRTTGYASAHPVSGEIIWSLSSAVCWV